MLRKNILVIVFFIFSMEAYAAGPHDGITCLGGCHSAHFAVDDKIFYC